MRTRIMTLLRSPVTTITWMTRWRPSWRQPSAPTCDPPLHPASGPSRASDPKRNSDPDTDPDLECCLRAVSVHACRGSQILLRVTLQGTEIHQS